MQWRKMLKSSFLSEEMAIKMKMLWFSLCIPVSSTNKTDRHDITQILLKVALNTKTQMKMHFA
jgi:hypothetical protein